MNRILYNLTAEEKAELKSLTDIKKFNDEKVEFNIFQATCQRIGVDAIVKVMNERKSLNEIVEGNKDVARLLITAQERCNGQSKDELMEEFVFDVTDPREEELQKDLMPMLVKKIREKTGLSQKAFASKYDISVHSLLAWEAGQKRISRYAYNYLKNVVTDAIIPIHTITQLTLPLDILDGESISFIKKSKDSSNGAMPDVRYIEGNEWQDGAYIIGIENYEEVEDEKLVYSWEIYPVKLQECIKAAIKYGCNQLYLCENSSEYTCFPALLNNKEKDVTENIETVGNPKTIEEYASLLAGGSEK